MDLDLRLGHDFTASASGALWTSTGLAKLQAAGMIGSGGMFDAVENAVPPVHRLISQDAADELWAAQAAARSALVETVAPFAVTPSVAAGFREGEHFTGPAGQRDWTDAGLAALRRAGWTSTLRTLPDVDAVLATRSRATPAAIPPALHPTSPPAPARPLPTSAAALPTPRLPPAAVLPAARSTPVIDTAAIYARRAQAEGHVSVADAPQIVVRAGRPNDFGRIDTSSVYRRRAWFESQAAGPKPQAERAGRGDAAAALPSPEDIYARRRAGTVPDHAAIYARFNQAENR